MFGSSVKQSSAAAGGSSISGVGDFSPTNTISFSRPLVDLTDPLQVAVAAGLAYIGWLAWKRFK